MTRSQATIEISAVSTPQLLVPKRVDSRDTHCQTSASKGSQVIILAHRGWWESAAEKNSSLAFEKALRGGFGIETDVRDCAGQLVISHDPPQAADLMTLDDFARLYRDAKSMAPLALNIKADGLQADVLDCLTRHRIANYFVFDMAVPDALGFLGRGVPTFTRQSKYELQPAFYTEAAGVWMDCFDGELCPNPTIVGHVHAGKKVALVSPELHRKPHEDAWKQWRALPADSMMLCTDFPDTANEYFNG